MATGTRGNRGLKRLFAAAGNSLAGLAAAWRHEAAFRQEAALGLILLPGSFWLGQTSVERILLAGSWLLVLVVELLNSAIEAAVDRVGTDRHELAGRAKDMGSAAVFLSMLIAGLAWAIIAWERFSG